MSNRMRRGGLGRGLGSLIPTAPEGEPVPDDAGQQPDPAAEPIAAAAEPATSAAYFAEVPLAAIHPNAKQPRQVFDEDALTELAHSIREFGMLQPVVVR